jgi:hypothetical protein
VSRGQHHPKVKLWTHFLSGAAIFAWIHTSPDNVLIQGTWSEPEPHLLDRALFHNPLTVRPGVIQQPELSCHHSSPPPRQFTHQSQLSAARTHTNTHTHTLRIGSLQLATNLTHTLTWNKLSNTFTGLESDCLNDLPVSTDELYQGKSYCHLSPALKISSCQNALFVRDDYCIRLTQIVVSRCFDESEMWHRGTKPSD